MDLSKIFSRLASSQMSKDTNPKKILLQEMTFTFCKRAII